MDTLDAGPNRHLAGHTAARDGREKSVGRPRDLRAERLRRHAVNMGLWTVQGWLAMFFIAAAWAKLTQPIALLQNMMIWPGLLSSAFVRLFGVCEALLGLAVIAPLISWRLRSLTLTATRTLLTLAGVAAAFHALRGPLWFSGLNAAIAGLCILVLVGRADPQVD